MQLFKLKSVMHGFDTFAEFAKAFELGERDLVITNEFIYEPYMKASNLACHFVFQEKYGAGEPSDEMMNNILADIKGINYDRIIAVGGGTVIDISKLFVLKGLENVLDAFDRKIPLIKEKKLVIVPTTCGTGSEVTNISIAEIKSRHTKMGLADDTIAADDAIIIPELLKGLPFRFYAASAIDALIHAIEAYVSPKASPYSRMFSEAAWQIILEVFKKIAEHGPEYRFEKMGEMIMASNFAGIAFGNAGVGAVHALSYPLGGNYHVPHGEANYQFFTEVFKVYQQKNPFGCIVELSWKLARIMDTTPELVFRKIDELLSHLLDKKPLKEYGMKDEEVRGFAENVMVTQQRLLANNYTELTVDDIEGIYRRLY
ncbi:4-hydroxybutyrate dehydrogenase [Porphyromonas cangingivalis]|uniref:4-hydroxybutyrate dehydrogenase n=1 Tax=Porphyromonas cangingivalis TaxID=36874 RepID=A0A0A2EVP6_PORCN|nr:4-hydroxybutyrate dehydrogenase [Porphyromonas cangingivalis]KGN82971.1 4-hydroxybutyrate dehydrogenase [Porphyromonas cangingivalis]